jgi:hypothetical protein
MNTHYLDSIETVLSWNLPEEAITNAINQQVTQNMDYETEDPWCCYSNQSEFLH